MPQYAAFRLNVQANNLFLVGDIGLVVDARLFQFLRRTLEQNRGCRIFYVMGNHEPYQITLEQAHKSLRDFEQDAKENFGGRFKFLCRDRYDLDKTITILGCTLWSAIQRSQESDIASRSTDLNSERGIRNWTLERHEDEHRKDLGWLNSQISTIERDEPHRQVIIATHYSPTIDPRANDPRHDGSSVSSNFVTDLSNERCWLSPMVKLWVFGHTHYSCSFCDEKTGKLVVANQKGYSRVGARGTQAGMKAKVVEAGEVWAVVKIRRSSGEEHIQAVDARIEEQVVSGNRGKTNVQTPKDPLLLRMTKRMRSLCGS